MSEYIVKDVVCDSGIFIVDDFGNEELVEVCNSRANALKICEILNADLEHKDYEGQQILEKDKMLKWQKEELGFRQDQIDHYRAIIENLTNEISYFSSKFRHNERFTKTGVWQKDLELYINECMIERFKELKNVIERKNNGTRNSSCSLEYKDGYSGCCCNIQSFIDEQIEEMGKEIDYERIPTKGINYDA